jgi:hypothetical protein
MAKQTRRKRQATKRRAPGAAATKTKAVSAAASNPAPRLQSTSNGWQLLLYTLRSMRTQWRFWLKFLALFGVLNLLLVHNFSVDVPGLKTQLSDYLGGQAAVTGLSTYALLLASSGSSGGAASVYQLLLLIIGSLSAIWALRQFRGGETNDLSLKNSLYQGMYPFVPFILTLLVIALALLPMLLTASLYSTVLTSGVTRTWFEQAIFLVIFLAGVGVSIWLVTRWIFALYIVTLPDIQPLQSLREAARLLAGKQLAVIRKILLLLVGLLVASVVIVVPVILLAAPLAQFVFFLLGIIVLPLTHSYLYNLYRELLP